MAGEAEAVKKGKLTPAGKLARRGRRAARKRRRRVRAQRRRTERVIAWLSDAPEPRGWEALVYSFSIPISDEAAERLRAAPGSDRIRRVVP